MNEQKYHIAALYQFVEQPNFRKLQQPLLEFCLQKEVIGSLLLAAEGINGTIAGAKENVNSVLNFLQGPGWFPGLEAKVSFASTPPFYRMKVRLKKEIVTMGVPSVNPRECVGTYVEPTQWNELLADPGLLLIDTRNDYEVAIGSFRGAQNPQINTFKEFPPWLRKHLPKNDNPKVAMFCTGGIRCEKSTSFLKQEGVKEVFHLKGGILKYLETIPEAESLWEGQCFVFDQRVSVGHGLIQGDYTLCRACRYPLSPENRAHPLYEEGVSCEFCFDKTSAKQKRGYAERHRQWIQSNK